MRANGGIGAVSVMNNHDDEVVQFATEKFERRLAEECGSLRVDMASEFGKVRLDMATESGKLRAEMATESGKLRAEMAAESGKLRAEMQQGFGDIRVAMHQGFGAIRAEMADRNADLLKWLLVYGATQTAALAGVLTLLR